jgi:phosphoglycerate dehydrogenase-like enzyme
MRIHIQNDPSDTIFELTQAQWDQAAARAPDIGGHQASFGSTPEAFARIASEVELLVVATPILRALLPLRAPRLHMIFVMTAGVDGLAPFDWLPEGLTLLNNSGAHAPKAGESLLTAMLMLAGNIPAFVIQQREQRWQKRYAPTLAGRRVAIVGTGDLGAAGARLARRIGVHVTGIRTRATPHPDFDEVIAVSDLDVLLPSLDMLALACPLTEATRGMIDRRRLSLLPRGAGLINIGRGKLLDQDALCDLLDSGHLSGAVLDVMEPEPLPPAHRLWATPNVIITPHISTDDPTTYNPLSLDILFANLRARRDGVPMPNRVNTARGY